MALAVVQSNAVAVSSSVPGTVALTSTPTVGNLIVVFLACNCADDLTINTSEWTVFGKAYQTNVSSIVVVGFYRYVVSGDTTTLPALCTSGRNTYHVKMVYEISGVSGNFATDNGGCIQTCRDDVTNWSPVDGTLMLVGHGTYNGHNIPTINTGWTLDQANANHGAYGSWGLASQSFSSKGDLAQAIFSGEDGGPTGSLMLALVPSTPTTPYVRQGRLTYKGSGSLPVVFNLTVKPNSGSLLVAFLGWGNGGSTPPSNVGSWTEFARTTSLTPAMLGYYRYTDGGADANSYSLVQSGSAGNAEAMFEIGGVSGVFADDAEIFLANSISATSTFITTQSYSTVASGDLSLIGACAWNGNTDMLVQSYSTLANGHDFADFGAAAAAFNWFGPSGSNPQTVTNSFTHGSAAMGAINLILRGTASSSSGGNAGSVLRLFPNMDDKRAYPWLFNSRGFPST